MRVLGKVLFSLSILAAPIFAGALVLQIGDPSANPEAQGKQAVLVARVTACHSPEKTTVTATAEGWVDGARKSIALKLIPLSSPGTFAVTREWPEQGAWAVKLTANNPEYKDYTSGVLVPLDKNSLRWAEVKHYSHAPTNMEVAEVLGSRPDTARISVH